MLTKKKERLLIVDDDVQLTKLVKQFLEQHHFDVDVLHNGESAVQWLQQYTPALIVLDVMLPEMDGLSVCREIRRSYHGPIIMLTALDEDIDEVAGLEVGADDYLSKPVKSRVLLAHIRAQLRRVETYSASDPTPEQQSEEISSVICAEALRINPGDRTVYKGNQLLEFTDAEFNLLYFLAKQRGHIVSRETVYREIFNLDYDGLDRSIDLRISRIRKKVEDDPKTPQIIKTIRGEGYLFCET